MWFTGLIDEEEMAMKELPIIKKITKKLDLMVGYTGTINDTEGYGVLLKGEILKFDHEEITEHEGEKRKIKFNIKYKLSRIDIDKNGQISQVDFTKTRITGYYYLSEYNWHPFSDGLKDDEIEVLNKENLELLDNEINVNKEEYLASNSIVKVFSDYIESRKEYLDEDLYTSNSLYKGLDKYKIYDFVYFIEDHGHGLLDLLVECILFSTNYQNILSTEDLFPDLFEITNLRWYDFTDETKEELKNFIQEKTNEEPVIKFKV